MCVYKAVKSEHRVMPGFQTIISQRGDSFTQAEDESVRAVFALTDFLGRQRGLGCLVSDSER